MSRPSAFVAGAATTIALLAYGDRLIRFGSYYRSFRSGSGIGVRFSRRASLDAAARWAFTTDPLAAKCEAE